MSSALKKDSVSRFSDRVENYVRYRPHYPEEIYSFLQSNCGLNSSSVIADIGSGPGISSEHFIENGNRVYAVEPNAAMREAAEKIFSGEENYISIDGKAESTGLPDSGIDFIISGQAFHWFDKSSCRQEFRRILKPGGYVVLMWNEKVSADEFMKKYFSLLDEFGTDYNAVKHENIDDEVIGRFFFPDNFHKKIFGHTHQLDEDGLTGRLLSSSYIPLEGEKNALMLKKLAKIFQEYENGGKVDMKYETIVYYGKLDH